jgi:outer membrane receptor for Fe3+-dicitrate
LLSTLSNERAKTWFLRFLSGRTRAKFAFVLCLESYFFPALLLAQEDDGLVDEFAAVSTLQRDELEEEFELLEDQDIVFTAAKHEQDIFDSPSAITVITREQILASPCNNIPCVLSQYQELEVRYTKPTTPAVGVRDMLSEASDNGLVLVDGRDIIHEEMGMPYWACLPLHLSDVERIEVIRGPGSALYGANAQSMVISIITREPKQDNAELYLASGEHGGTSLHARVDQVFGPWRLQLTGGYEGDDAWEPPPRPARKVYRTNLKVLRSVDSSTVLLSMGFQSVNAQVYSILAPGQFKDTLEGHGQLSYENPWLKAGIWFALGRYDLYLDMPLFYQGIKLGTFIPSLPSKPFTLDADTQAHSSFFPGNILLGGVNYRFLEVILEPNDPIELYQHRIGVYLQDEQRLWDQLLITAGARFDYNSVTPATFSPRLSIGWRFVLSQLLRLSVGRSFRKPSFMQSSVHLNGIKGTSAFPELEKFFHDNIGNPDLTNASLSAYEIGYRGQFFSEKLTLEADVFYNQYRDGVGFVVRIVNNSLGLPDLGHSLVRFENNSDIDSVGGSISLSYKPLPRLWLSLNYTYRYSVYLPSSDLIAGGMTDNSRLEWEPEHLANATFQYRMQNGLLFALALHARSSADFWIPTDGGVFSAQKISHNPSNLYLNAEISYRFTSDVSDRHYVEVGLQVFNTFNRLFYDTRPIIRFDGVSVGGEPLVRSAQFYLHAGW